jgi:hypothetical protein
LVNVAYSYAIIEAAARSVQSSPMWKDDIIVKKLKFTNKWIVGFLQRNWMTRRKITTECKNLPTAAEVNATMEKGHAIYRDKGYISRWVWNMDETAYTYAIGPTHIFLPKGTRRAHGSSSAKARVTAVVMVNGEGTFAPTMMIIRHNVAPAVAPAVVPAPAIYEEDSGQQANAIEAVVSNFIDESYLNDAYDSELDEDDDVEEWDEVDSSDDEN